MLNNQLIIVSQTSTWTAALEHKFGPIPPVDRKVCPHLQPSLQKILLPITVGTCVNPRLMNMHVSLIIFPEYRSWCIIYNNSWELDFKMLLIDSVFFATGRMLNSSITENASLFLHVFFIPVGAPRHLFLYQSGFPDSR